MTAAPHFFVVGCPRSGTTLLAVLLDRHSRLAVPPETAFFDEIAPRLWIRSRRRLLSVLRSWRRLPELELDAETIVARLPERRWSPRDVFSVILQSYAELRGKTRGGEKTPQHLRHASTILRAFPDARMICMQRDGRDNALSLQAMPWWHGDLAHAARLWKQNVRLAEQGVRKFGERFLIVRYEDLLVDPENTLANVMTFLGERFEPGQTSAAVRTDVVLQRSVEWKGRALEPIDAAHGGRRYRDASPADRAFLERALREELARLGY